MINNEFIETAEAEIIPVRIKQLADSRRRESGQVIAHRGCYWQEITRGFFEPVHLLARLNLDQAFPPTKFRWGFRLTLCDDASNAHGTNLTHLLINFEDL